MGSAVSLLLLAAPSVAEERVPLSRVLLTETDLRASIAKVSLARHYLARAAQGSSQSDGSSQKAGRRAAESLQAAIFYLDSSLALSRGDLRRDLEALRDELHEVRERMELEPSKALDDLQELEERFQEVLGGIDRASRTYKGSQGWVSPWAPRDGQPPPETLVPSR